MMLIRPIEERDADTLVDLAKHSGVGVTSLPANAELLAQRIDTSVRSFRRSQPKERGNYVFVLEDTDLGKVVGISAIEANVGLENVFYSYRLTKVVHASKEIGVHITNDMLSMSNDLTGVSELCTLFLEEGARKGNNGRLLSKSRMLFLAENRTLFDSKIIAEMRGVSDASGRSPFWESLGKKFFQMDFSYADYQVGVGNKELIAELMPKYPIYMFLLSSEARSVVGKTHEFTRPALEMLKTEGFHFNGYVDIFDAGPVVECFVEEIRAVRASKLCSYRIDDTIELKGDQRSDYVASNQGFERFRAILIGAQQVRGEELVLNSEQAQALGLNADSQVRVVPLRYS